MMPTLPPPHDYVRREGESWEEHLQRYARAYGRAVAEACAVICMKLVDSDDPAQCAHEIRKAVKEIGR